MYDLPASVAAISNRSLDFCGQFNGKIVEIRSAQGGIVFGNFDEPDEHGGVFLDEDLTDEDDPDFFRWHVNCVNSDNSVRFFNSGFPYTIGLGPAESDGVALWANEDEEIVELSTNEPEEWWGDHRAYWSVQRAGASNRWHIKSLNSTCHHDGARPMYVDETGNVFITDETDGSEAEQFVLNVVEP
ncbi:MAG: hypothetical protein AAF799_30035 [Myxococcota bacterium]